MIKPAERVDRLTKGEVAAVLDLASSAGDTDGAFPLSEHVVLHLRHGGDLPSVHLLVRTQTGDLAGYAHVDVTDVVDGPAAEIVVHPQYRRHGIGRELVTAAVDVAQAADPAGRLRLWAHGDHPSASALALSLGFLRSRVLWQLRRSLFAEVPQPALPPGVSLRTFRPGVDEQAWLALNAKAFADHPEQGRWTERDLRFRMAEPWFDPAGFLLAVTDGDPHSVAGSLRFTAGLRRDSDSDGVAGSPNSTAGLPRAEGQLVGFHWTKVHGELRGLSSGEEHQHQHEPIGEVYVLGVDPAMHGTGLGRALTAAGLRHLRARGLDQVMLYVDESNRAATSLYTGLGFARWSTDVLFTRTGAA